ncbi:Synapse-associated protein, partial [Operophtera brumata]
SILGEFNREQDAFIKGQAGGAGAAVAPWIGAPNEAGLKEECLSLSTDRRNFVRAPPAGVEFDFDYDKMYNVALAIMEEDPNLEKMRFDLVPKMYHHRGAVLAELLLPHVADHESASDLKVSEKSSQESIDDAKERIKSLRVDKDNDDEQWEKELDAELKEYEVVVEKTGDDKHWEKECEDLLGDDLDLK